MELVGATDRPLAGTANTCGDIGPVTIAEAGTYTVRISGTDGAIGAYSFVIKPG